MGDAGDPIVRYRAEDEHDEAAWVAGEILRLRAAESLPWGDVAVFYRTNAQSRALEDSFVFAEHPLQGGRRGPVLRPPRGQGRPGLPPGAGQPRRRGARPGASSTCPSGGSATTSVARLAGLGPGQPGVVRRGDRPGRGGRAVGQGAARRPAAVRRCWPSCDRWSRPSTRPTSCNWWPTAPGYLAELVAEHTLEADGRIENIDELVGVAGEFDDLVGLPRDGGPGGRLRRDRRGRHPGLADDPAHGQGPRVPGRLRGRPGGRDLPPLCARSVSRSSSRRSAGSSTSGSPGPGGTCPSPTPGAGRSSGAPSTTSPAAS